MFIFSFYVNLVSVGLREQHLKTHIKWPGILRCVVPENIHTPTKEGIGHSGGVGGGSKT